MQPVVNSSLNIIIDADSAVSEKVLLDTVAEKEVMDRVEVSCYNNMKKRKKKKRRNNKGLFSENYYIHVI